MSIDAKYEVRFIKSDSASTFRVIVTDDDPEPVVLYDVLVASEDLAASQRKALNDMARFFHWFVGTE